MKKVLALTLALALILSLCALTGCTKEDTEPASQSPAPASAAPQDAEPSEPAEPAERTGLITDAEERIANGEDVLVCMCLQTLADDWMLSWSSYLEERFKEVGCSFYACASEQQVSLMLEQIENCVTMGAGAIIVAAPDGDSVYSTCKDAMEKGSHIIFMGITPTEYEVSGGANVNWAKLGEVCAQMACAWAAERYPDAGDGEIHAGHIGTTATVDHMALSESVYEVFEADPRIELTYTYEGQASKMDEAFTLTQDAFTIDADIKIITTFQDQLSIGVNNYIVAIPDVDLSAYATFSVGIGEAGLAMIETAKNGGESVYRGVAAYGADKGGEKHGAENLYTVTWGVLNGEPTPYWIFDDIWTIDSFGYDYSA